MSVQIVGSNSVSNSYFNYLKTNVAHLQVVRSIQSFDDIDSLLI